MQFGVHQGPRILMPRRNHKEVDFPPSKAQR
jgi:hypothetical protein